MGCLGAEEENGEAPGRQVRRSRLSTVRHPDLAVPTPPPSSCCCVSSISRLRTTKLVTAILLGALLLAAQASASHPALPRWVALHLVLSKSRVSYA